MCQAESAQRPVACLLGKTHPRGSAPSPCPGAPSAHTPRVWASLPVPVRDPDGPLRFLVLLLMPSITVRGQQTWALLVAPPRSAAQPRGGKAGEGGRRSVRYQVPSRPAEAGSSDALPLKDRFPARAACGEEMQHRPPARPAFRKCRGEGLSLGVWGRLWGWGSRRQDTPPTQQPRGDKRMQIRTTRLAGPTHPFASTGVIKLRGQLPALCKSAKWPRVKVCVTRHT